MSPGRFDDKYVCSFSLSFDFEWFFVMDFFPSQELNCPSFRWSATGIPVFDPGKKHRFLKKWAPKSQRKIPTSTLTKAQPWENTKVEIEIRWNVDKYAYHTWILSMPQGNPFHGKQRMSKNDYNFDVLVWWLGKIWKQRQKMVPNGDESHGGIREKPPTKQAKVKEPKWILGDITRNLRHNSSTLSSVWVVWKFQS